LNQEELKATFRVLSPAAEQDHGRGGSRDGGLHWRPA
jgi:hypothetical protein